jgi:hypothetical protein
MSFFNTDYAPPDVYTRTTLEAPGQRVALPTLLPFFIGEGLETLSQDALPLVRGSSASVDQNVVKEDQAGRAVVSVSDAGVVTLGAFDGTLARFQVKNFPIVDGSGSGTTSNRRTDVIATINGRSVVVRAVDGAKGIVTLAEEPQAGDEVRCTYFFNRTDTYQTDDLSDQVTATSAILEATSGVASTYSQFNDTNNTFTVTVDGESETDVVFPLSGSPGTATFSPTQIASFLNSASVGSLVASTFTNNFGDTALRLTADQFISIGGGSANAVLGFATNQQTNRRKTFYTYNGAIVDGTNGGVTTTNVADVAVTVDGVSVTPTAVDGKNRAVTLPVAPKAGAVVKVSYYHNTWQDTFDYLAHINVLSVDNCGVAPGRSDYVEKADFILKDDKILWGTSAVVGSGVHTTGKELFDDSQVSLTLIDDKRYLAPCTTVTNTSTVPASESSTVFKLPLQPTTGNGRNSPLGASLYNSVSNGRLDLPTDRPDLVTAYWGYGVQDALDRGAVTVIRVDSETSQIELKNAVPKGATVYATFFYNRLTDGEFDVEVVKEGISGVGTYKVTDSGNNPLHNVDFDTATKSGLSGISLEFPSGSELRPDARFELSGTSVYTGAVEEVATVTFQTRDDTPAKFSIPGQSPYYLVNNESDKMRVKIDAADLAGAAAGVDLSDPTGKNSGFLGTLLGEEVVYDADAASQTFTLTAADNSTSILVDGLLIDSSVAVGALRDLSDFAAAINAQAASVNPQFKGATNFTDGYTVVANEYDQLSIHYTGDVGGLSGTQQVTLTPGIYNTAADLAAQVNTQLATINGALGGLDGSVTCEADANGRLTFTFVKAGADASGFFEFIDNATADRDFCVVAGVDTGATASAGQTKIVDGEVARRFTVAGGSGALSHDRLVLRNRIMPGNAGSLSHHYALAQTGLSVQSDSVKAGLLSGRVGMARNTASINKASLLGTVPFSKTAKQTAVGNDGDGLVTVTFYDGTGANPANNIFRFTLDGYAVTVTFSASAGGTQTAIGPTSVATSVIRQIEDALVAVPGQPFGNLATVQGKLLVRLEGGNGLRITSDTYKATSEIVVGDGSANSALGFSEAATASRTLPEAEHIASALMNHAQSTANFNTWLLTNAGAATYFVAEALAGINLDSANQKYLFFQSQTLGTSSAIEFDEATTSDILLPQTGLGLVDGDGAVGEQGISGFYVTSTDSKGSGSANTSTLNGGTGQDGVVGQTYVDDVTGLTFTILPRTGSQSYPNNASFQFSVSKTVTTDANLPKLLIPGVEMTVSNTTNVPVGDTAVVETFERGGEEPSIGDVYYASYTYQKDGLTPGLYSKLRTVEAEFGAVSVDNPLSLAFQLALINGATVVGLSQVLKEDGSSFGSLSDYYAAVDALEKPLPGGIKPDILTALRGDSLPLFQYMSRSADVMSTPRYQSERTVVAGVSAGTTPETMKTWANTLNSSRFRFVYPDSVFVTLTDGLGNSTEVLADGVFLLCGLVGLITSPNQDVATPWTGRNLQGYGALGRQLSIPQMNDLAVNGVTVLEEEAPLLKVRHGLTTDMSNLMTRIPTIAQIADAVQQGSRVELRPFIGTKDLGGQTSQVEGRINQFLKAYQKALLIVAYTGIEAVQDPNDPTSIEVEAYYAPVLPTLYLFLSYFLRASL